MSSKRRLRRQACEGKRAYYEREAAQLEANRLWKGGERVRPYQCKFCKRWHIGHLPKWLRQSLRDTKLRSDY